MPLFRTAPTVAAAVFNMKGRWWCKEYCYHDDKDDRGNERKW